MVVVPERGGPLVIGVLERRSEKPRAGHGRGTGRGEPGIRYPVPRRQDVAPVQVGNDAGTRKIWRRFFDRRVQRELEFGLQREIVDPLDRDRLVLANLERRARVRAVVPPYGRGVGEVPVELL